MNMLSDHLQRHGITQAQFADRAGVNQGFVSRLCRGLVMPSLEKAAHIERITGGEVPMSSWVPAAASPLGNSRNTIIPDPLGSVSETVNTEGGA
ncbi:hypothetical protein CNY89_10530 [Amaricoccus sp. HAR-UPW-R2A-40]|nr:hypothetical protein CNY89_10530 [Amaricoccus sp. HAR-UPW-R2A-40]